MNRKILYLTLGVCIAWLSGGCGIFTKPSYTVTHNYDLKTPTALETSGFDVTILPFASDTAGRYKMVARSGVELYQDDYNRWTQTPSMLLTRYLRMALPEDHDVRKGTEPVYELSGVVLAFEADLKTSTAFLCVRYSIMNRKTGKMLRNGLARYHIPLNKKLPFPDAFALAMSEAAEKFVMELYSVMKQLKGNAGKQA